MGTSYTGDWMPTGLSADSADLTDQYVQAAVSGGLSALVLQILVLVRGFRCLGLARRQVTNQSPGLERLVWGFGVALFAYTATIFDVSFWDQSRVVWFGFLALVASLTGNILSQKPTVPSPEDLPIPSANPVGLGTADLC